MANDPTVVSIIVRIFFLCTKKSFPFLLNVQQIAHELVLWSQWKFANCKLQNIATFLWLFVLKVQNGGAFECRSEGLGPLSSA